MPEARIISYDSIYYHTAYGETPDSIEGIANNTVLDATYLPALVADGMQFMGWYSTHTFDDGTEVSVGDLVRDHSSNGTLHLYAKWSTLTVSSVLTDLADEIRVLSGTTEPLGLSEMATNVNDANDEVADQTDLIAQLASALQGKSVPGGGEDVTAETETYTDLLTDLEAAVDALPNAGSGGGSSVETCSIYSVSYQGDTGLDGTYYAMVYKDGIVTNESGTFTGGDVLNITNVVCGSIFAIQFDYKTMATYEENGVVKLTNNGINYRTIAYLAPTTAGAEGKLLVTDVPLAT